MTPEPDGALDAEPPSRPGSRSASVAVARAAALGVTLTAAGVLAFALAPAQAGQPIVFAALGGFYGVLAALALVQHHRAGDLRHVLVPVRGDITLAAVTAGALYGAARIVASLIAPHGSPRELWVARLYLQVGALPETKLLGLAVFFVAALEELTWRGLVMNNLERVTSRRRAAVLTTLLYAAAHLPSLSVLRMRGVGYNPLLVVAALGCGAVWSVLALRTGRLTPVVLAHALFSWSVIEFPLWQPG
jgi:membrane protease YdiL (CAAX protease family)